MVTAGRTIGHGRQDISYPVNSTPPRPDTPRPPRENGTSNSRTQRAELPTGEILKNALIVTVNPSLRGKMTERLLGEVLNRRELIKPELLHNFRVPGAEPLVVFPRPRRRATPIHEGMHGDQHPSLHLFSD